MTIPPKGVGFGRPRIGSFCTGIAGLDLATSAHFDAEVVWHCEFDVAPSKVLAHHFPDVPNHGDITATDWADVAPIDILTAGYPCQPFSTAGQRKGNEDERHIWPAIQNAIGHLRPHTIVLENVRGHLSLGFADVLADLAGLGFNAEWRTFRSSDIGAPHRRERLYVVASHPNRLVGPPAITQHSRPQQPGRKEPRIDQGHSGTLTADTSGSASRQPQLNPLDKASVTTPKLGKRNSPCNWGRYTGAIQQWETITGAASPNPLDDRGRINPELTEWMMGYPAGWVTDPAIGLTRAQQLKACGNAVQPQTAALALDVLTRRTTE
jgi:DNA (cytosine-5)-methyltransferase 1